MSERDTRTVRSFCRICTSVCGVLVDVSGDEVVRVRGDHEHPMSHGYTCAKGRALPQMHHHPDRLERPLMRVGTQLEPATWDACLDDLAARLRTIIDSDGPEAIGIFFGSGVGMDAAGYRMAEALHAAIGTPARFSPLTIDGTAKTIVSHQMGGFPGLTPHLDAERAELVVYVGVNPVVSHGHTSAMPDPVTAIRALRDRANVWVVDPRRTETARLATRHLAPRPGTDYAVLAFLVREVLSDGADRETLDNHTVGSDALASAVAPFTVEHAATIADVAGIRPDRAPRRSATGRASRRRHGDGRHDVGERQRDAMARVGADDPDRFDEPPRWRVVPSGLPPSARVVRAPDLTARRPVIPEFIDDEKIDLLELTEIYGEPVLVSRLDHLIDQTCCRTKRYPIVLLTGEYSDCNRHMRLTCSRISDENDIPSFRDEREGFQYGKSISSILW